ncbi:MAG: glycosyltransferase family 4 protein [Candidatus Nomurabacteria bacterium]|nr:glycosyltransferase family 4 protein [Candidatus Nomurabacteria bacterium]USN88133.1 MAG: glycosyltransferase family 4 protein [Candidatus Nomurabacteria bacterium]
MKKKVLIVHQQTFGLEHIGGAEAVCVWMLEALKGDYELSLAVPHKGAMLQDISRINDQYGTNLRPQDFKVIEVKGWSFIRPLVSWSWFLHTFVFMLLVRLQAKNYDVCISSYNEFDFGNIQSLSLQYIHYPMIDSTTKSGVRHALSALFGYKKERVDEYKFMTCSNWTANVIREHYPTTDVATVYPPVKSVLVSNRSFLDRDNNFLFVGRISPEKRIEKCIEIIKSIRDKGYDVGLTIVGPIYKDMYAKKIKRIAEDNSWIKMVGSVTNLELDKICQEHRFGINGTKDEQFGIVLAEMQRSGCVVFVPNGGGQLEIVNDNRLIYNDKADAVTKIINVLDDESLQTELHSRVLQTSEVFSSAKYVERIKEKVKQI